VKSDGSSLRIDQPAPVAAEDAASHRDKPTIPDYLREPRRKRRLLPASGFAAIGRCHCGGRPSVTGNSPPGTYLGNLLHPVRCEMADESVGRQQDGDGGSQLAGIAGPAR